MAPDNRQLLATGEMRLHALRMPHNARLGIGLLMMMCPFNSCVCFLFTCGCIIVIC
jgi:hypothetical protein